jgi:hypothetical protein
MGLCASCDVPNHCWAQSFGLDVKQSSFLSIMPWAAMALGTNMSGWAADVLTNRKVRACSTTAPLWCV